MLISFGYLFQHFCFYFIQRGEVIGTGKCYIAHICDVPS